MSGWRLPVGGQIKRGMPLDFTWAGRRFSGFAGDTLASALLASGVSVVGRSFKYHRPRGVIAAGAEEPNAIVQLEKGNVTIPNLKATQIELYRDLNGAPVNAWPSAEFDLLAITSLFKRFIPAAFYYKTFFWPNWHLFEPAIRRAAGLGVAPTGADPDKYGHRFFHTDTLVVGAGAAGLAAAITAADRGERVLLVESDFETGGGLLATDEVVEGLTACEWLANARRGLSMRHNVKVLPRTTAFGFYDHNMIALCERLTDHVPPQERSGIRQRLWKVRAGRVILATGAFERPLAFANNDRPGVMLASAAQTYALRYGVAVGRRVVVATNNDSAYRAAFAMHDAGIPITAIVDSRPASAGLAAEASSRSIRIVSGSLPLAASGRRRVKSLVIEQVASRGTGETIECDTVLMSGGWNPVVHLHSQSGSGLTFDSARQAFLPTAAVQNVVSVGAAAGIDDITTAIDGSRSCASCVPFAVPSASSPVGPILEYEDGDAAAHSAWLDLQNDVTVGDIQLAARENFRSVEHVKRYTTLGMASDQGKTSNVTAIQVLGRLLGKAPSAVGTTKFRPPFDPVTIGTFSGLTRKENLMPVAHLAAHNAQVALRGKMENYGRWIRSTCYPHAGESDTDAVTREVNVVRHSAGLFDASPLGKIEVKGPDAAEFLDRMYVNGVKTLKVGRCRYGLMLNERGVIYDDGVLARIGEDHFLVGTTSGHASAISDGFQEWLQCYWSDLSVLTTDVTTNWAVLNLAGPRARAILEAVGSDIDLSREAFPHMSYRHGNVAGVPARIQRVSFTGELSFEVSVPWGYGAALWDAIMAAGTPFGLMPFGVDALMVMRIEKGFLHVGSDTDGTTMPQDVGFGAIAARKAGDFIGRRSTMTPEARRVDRRHFVGLEVTDRGPVLTVGAHILPSHAQEPQETEGWVTSAMHSPTLDRPLALALIVNGRARIGEPVKVWDMGKWRSAEISDWRFYDPLGERLDG